MDPAPAATPLADWVGRTQQQHDALDSDRAARLAAVLDQDPTTLTDGAALPPLFHWIYFLTAAPARALGRDGHPVDGGFPPPVPASRRMWAGGRLTFHRPLVLGRAATRTSRIETVREKSGRTGTLVFVTVRHTITQAGQPAVTEDHDILYRPEAGISSRRGGPAQAPDAPVGAHTTRTVVCDPVLLFRYSALTFNGHRIHYDRDYARDVEGYPGLVVHGPLTATLLAHLAVSTAPGQRLCQFAFRATAPLFDAQPIGLHASGQGDERTVWALNQNDQVAMTATATLAPAA